MSLSISIRVVTAFIVPSTLIVTGLGTFSMNKMTQMIIEVETTLFFSLMPTIVLKDTPTGLDVNG